MPSPAFSPTTRLVIGLVALVTALSAGACGRRGPLEPPSGGAPEPRATSQGPASSRVLPDGIGIGGGSTSPDPDAVRDGDEVSAAATVPGLDSAPLQTSRGAKRGYIIPKQPFFLDPIL